MPEQSEPELYVVVNVKPSADPAAGHVTVTDPMPEATADLWAMNNAWSFPGYLEVRPATQADLDESGEGA